MLNSSAAKGSKLVVPSPTTLSCCSVICNSAMGPLAKAYVRQCWTTLGQCRGDAGAVLGQQKPSRLSCAVPIRHTLPWAMGIRVERLRGAVCCLLIDLAFQSLAYSWRCCFSLAVPSLWPKWLHPLGRCPKV